MKIENHINMKVKQRLFNLFPDYVNQGFNLFSDDVNQGNNNNIYVRPSVQDTYFFDLREFYFEGNKIRITNTVVIPIVDMTTESVI